AVEAFLQWIQGRALIPRLTAAAGIAAGPFLYFLYWRARFGDFWAPLHAQQNWGRTLSSPITTIRWALTYADPGTYQLVDVLVVGVVLLAVVAGVRMLRPSYAVYAIASLRVPLCYWASFGARLSI